MRRPATILHFFSLFAVLAVFIPGSTQAQNQPSVGGTQRVIVVDPLGTARTLIERGDFRAAASILDALDAFSETDRPPIDGTEISFLQGQVAYGEARYDDAAEIYAGLLVDNPKLTRVRLELGRALYALRRDVEAERQFELALAGDLPNPAIDNVESFLAQIDDRKIIRTRFAFSLVPDSNINQATDGETVDIFGLPFTLNEEARERSGFGVFGSAGVEIRPRLSNRLRLAAGIQGQRTEFEGRAFDDTIISASLGPEITLGRAYLTLSATGFRRWFGGEGFNSGIGGRANLAVRLSRRMRLDAEISGQIVEYDLNAARDGPVVSLVAGPTWSLDAASRLGLVAGISREFADVDFQRSTAVRLGGSYSKDFTWGLTASLRPQVVWRVFDADSPAFGERREDVAVEVSLDVMKRDIRILGLVPTLGYSFSRTASTIGLFDFSRHRARFGLVKRF